MKSFFLTIGFILNLNAIAQATEPKAAIPVSDYVEECEMALLPVPFHAFTHYKTWLEITPKDSQNIGEAWSGVVENIYSWLSSKYSRSPNLMGSASFEVGEFKKSGKWNVKDKFGSSTIQTHQMQGNGLESSPQYWTLLLEHPDQHITERRWRTDIGLTVREGKIFLRFSVRHWVPEKSEIAHFPERNVPRVITQIFLDAKAGKWKATSSGLPVQSTPITVGAGEAKFFTDVLKENDREVPIVYLSRNSRTGQFAIDPLILARTLHGAAMVFTEGSVGVSYELDSFIPKPFKVWNGAVRVYRSRVDFEKTGDEQRHIIFTEPFLRTKVRNPYQAIFNTVTSSEVQSADNFSDLDIFSMQELLAREREIIIQKRQIEVLNAEANVDTSLVDREYLKAIEEINAVLEAENKELKRERASLYEDKAFEHLRNEELEESLALLKAQNQKLERMIESLKSKNQASTKSLNLDHISTLPKDLEEAVILIEKIFPERVVVMDRARKSAAKASSDSVNVGWRMLYSIATKLYDLYFNNNGKSVDIEKEFLEQTGFEFATSEGQQTNRVARLKNLRLDTYNGKTIDFSAHLKWGKRPPKLIRIHVYIDREQSKIVIPHVGDHLETAGTVNM